MLRALATVGAILVALGATACGDDVGQGRSSDGAITVYSGREESLVGALLAQFEADNGIDIEVRYGNTAQLQEEGDRSPADVFYA